MGQLTTHVLDLATGVPASGVRIDVHEEYFRGRGVALAEPAFIEQAVVRIGIADPQQNYHVPLLITPWSYSVYRGG